MSGDRQLPSALGGGRLSPLRVVMLVNNDWRHDSRVRREAECLAAAGHTVHVVCRRWVDEALEECEAGICYVVEPYATRRVGKEFYRWIFPQHLWVLGCEARRVLSGPARAAALTTALGLALVIPLGAAGALLWPAARGLTRLLGRTRVGRRVDDASAEPLRAVHAWLQQGVVYLNGYAERCTETVEGLCPDVVHAHDLVTLSAGARVAGRLGVPLVYDAHELETHTNYHSLNRLTRFWMRLYERTLIRRCAGVVTVCDSIADWLADAYQTPRPVVVMNTPSVSTTAAGAPGGTGGVRFHLGLDREIPLVVYVGSVTVDRGLALTVEAIARLPGTHFAAVGPRYEVTAGEITEAARRLGIENRVHLVDPVEPAEVIGFIASADCSIIPIQNVCLSYYFCFPNKLLESVMAGLPVVAADLAELRRFIERFPVGVIVDESDPEAVARGISEVLADRARFVPGEAIRRLIRADYGWPVQAARLVDLYGNLREVTHGGADRLPASA